MCAVASLKLAATQAPRPSSIGLRIASARAADQPDIFYLLAAAMRGISTGEFQAQLDAPGYEPSHRHVAFVGPQMAGHVFGSCFRMRFGTEHISVGEINDLVTLPEFRRRGVGTRLLAHIERTLSAQGVVAASIYAAEPAFFTARGWSNCPAPCCSEANARDVLATMLSRTSDSRAQNGASSRPLNIRPWRHVEQEALIRLFNGSSSTSFGTRERSDDYWHWLLSRRGFDRIYVAIDGPDHLDLTDQRSPLVGYAVARRERIVELVTAPGHNYVAQNLLARACHDAIERNETLIRYEGPFNDAVHSLLLQAGGRLLSVAEHHERSLVKILALQPLLESMLPLWNERWKKAELPRPCEFGLECVNERFALLATPRGMKVEPTRRTPRNRLIICQEQLPQLLFGMTSANHLLRAKRATASTQLAQSFAVALFPSLSFWRSSFDRLSGLQ